MESGYGLKNIFNKLSVKQIIAIIAAVIVVILLIVLLSLLGSDMVPSSNSGGEQTNGDESVVTGEETYTDEQGRTVTKETMVDEDGDVVVKETKTVYYDEQEYTLTKETMVNENGETIVKETKMDYYGNVTTVEPGMITTYFPYQVMRKHGDMEPTLRYFLWVDDGTKVINALIEYCDEEGDKTMVQDYINSVPVDLSSYTVKYETFSEDSICSE